MKIEIHRSIREVKENIWNSLLKEDDIFASYRFIQVVEDSTLEKCKFWYAMVYEKENFISSAVFFSISIDGALLIKRKLRRLIKIIRGLYKKFLIFNVLICGLPVSLGKSNIRIVENTEKKELILNMVVRKMVEIADREQIKILVFKEFNGEEIRYYDYLTTIEFTKVHSLPSQRLRIKWDSFNDYLQALRKRYRQSILHSLKKMKKEEVKIELHQDFENIYSTDEI